MATGDLMTGAVIISIMAFGIMVLLNQMLESKCKKAVDAARDMERLASEADNIQNQMLQAIKSSEFGAISGSISDWRGKMEVMSQRHRSVLHPPDLPEPKIVRKVGQK